MPRKKAKAKTGGGANGARGTKISTALRLKFFFEVYGGATVEGLSKKYQGTLVQKTVRDLFTASRKELERIELRAKHEVKREIQAKMELAIDTAWDQVVKSLDEIDKQTKTTIDAKGGVKTEVTEKAGNYNAAMATFRGLIETQAKICGIYDNDFDADDGLPYEVMDITVESTQQFKEFEKISEAASFQDFKTAFANVRESIDDRPSG